MLDISSSMKLDLLEVICASVVFFSWVRPLRPLASECSLDGRLDRPILFMAMSELPYFRGLKKVDIVEIRLNSQEARKA